jgi:hypothetical protein
MIFRRKSELPHDIATLNALDKHKRTQDFLATTPDQSTNTNNTATTAN